MLLKISRSVAPLKLMDWFSGQGSLRGLVGFSELYPRQRDSEKEVRFKALNLNASTQVCWVGVLNFSFFISIFFPTPKTFKHRYASQGVT